MSRADLAERIGESPRNLRRKLNGEYPAKFEDILRWALVLERPDIIYVPGRPEHLAPDGLAASPARLIGGHSAAD